MTSRAWPTAVAVVLGAALAVYPLAVAPERPAVAVIAVVALLCMGAALGRPSARGLAWPAALFLALHYGAALHVGAIELDVYAPLVAVGLFAFVEAMDLSISLADVAPISRPALARRMVTLGVVSIAGGFLALVGILARSLFAGALSGVLVGAACVLGVVALPLWMATSGRTR